MKDHDLDAFVAAYFEDHERLQRRSRGTRAERLEAQRYDDERLKPSPEEQLARLDHEEAWPIVVALIDRAPTQEALYYVAAEPLEDLIRGHGRWVGARVLEQARADSRFREALSGVWGFETLSEPLRSDLLRAVGRPQPERPQPER